MSETGPTRNGTMLVSVVLGLLALAGWGAFAYAVHFGRGSGLATS